VSTAATSLAGLPAANKPLVVAETGVNAINYTGANTGSTPCRTSNASRATVFNSKLPAFINNSSYPNIDGANVWGYAIHPWPTCGSPEEAGRYDDILPGDPTVSTVDYWNNIFNPIHS
jgi:hypothetical protein